MDPISAIIAIADGVAGPETLRWFRERVTAYLTEPSRPTLEQAFELSSAGPGKPSERTRYMKAARDLLLADAFDMVSAPGERIMTRCARLAEEIRRFERSWPRLRDLPEPPPGTTELHRILFRARRTGQPIPDTSQGLYQTLYQRR